MTLLSNSYSFSFKNKDIRFHIFNEKHHIKLSRKLGMSWIKCYRKEQAQKKEENEGFHPGEIDILRALNENITGFPH